VTEGIRKIINVLTVAEMVVGGVCFFVLTALMAIDVASREITNEGLEWAQKGAIVLMIWGGVIGASLTSAKGGHLRPEIADKLWPEKFKPVLKVVEHLLVTAFCVFMFYLALNQVAVSKEQGDIHPVLMGIPIWSIQLIFPFVFVSMGLRHFIFAIAPDLRPDDHAEITKAMDEYAKEEVGY
jgi:TRAP-type C4-dicarboxylate transport system permease small subunit